MYYILGEGGGGVTQIEQRPHLEHVIEQRGRRQSSSEPFSIDVFMHGSVGRESISLRHCVETMSVYWAAKGTRGFNRAPELFEHDFKRDF